MAGKVKRLEISFIFEFELLGLRSSVKEFKLAWSINNSLEIELIKQPDYEIQFRDGLMGKISLYTFDTENSTISLLKNRLVESSDGKVRFLIPELSHIDYFIRIDGDSYPNTPEKISTNLKGLETVEYLSAFNPNDLKSKENLLLY